MRAALLGRRKQLLILYLIQIDRAEIATLKYAFQDINYLMLVIFKKRKTQKETLT